MVMLPLVCSFQISEAAAWFEDNSVMVGGVMNISGCTACREHIVIVIRSQVIDYLCFSYINHISSGVKFSLIVLGGGC